MSCRSILLSFALLAGAPALTACRTGSSEASVKDSSGAPQPKELASQTSRAVHGMVVFGKNTVYMYHLPMWQNPHKWQIILEVSLDQHGQDIYKREVTKNAPLVTISPVAFPLASLAPGSTFQGTLYHGHFEQGGSPLPSGNGDVVTVTVRRLVTVNPLDPNGEQLTTPLYRVFGKGSEWYATHIASHAPDFDQVVAIAPLGDTAPSTSLAVTLPDQTNDFASRPTPGSNVSGQTSDGSQVQFNVTKEIYKSTDDLGG